jgi:O-antigen/teichoic acid export membrane protein
MKKLNPFAKSSLFYFFATVIGQGFTFLGIIVFTHIMPQDSYGLYSTYYAYVSICAVLVGANLFIALNNAYIDYKDKIHRFRKTTLFLSSLICLAILTVLLAVRFVFFKQIALPVVLFAIAHSYSFFVVNYRMYSANMENDRITKSLLLILPNAFQFVFAVLLILYSGREPFMARVVGSTLGVLSCAVVAYVSMMHSKGALIQTDYWEYALKISVPTIAMSISYMLMQQCDKVMITSICGENHTAVYSAIYYLSYALIVVNQSVGAVRQAWAYKMLDKGETDLFPVLQKWYLCMIGVVVLGTFMIAPEAIRLLLPRSYWDYSYVAPFVFSAAMIVMYSFYSDIALFYKKNTVFSSCVMAAAILNLVLNAIFIRIFGAVAAAYTTAVSYLFLFTLLHFFFGNAPHFQYRLKSFFAFLIGVSVFSAVYLFEMDRPALRYVSFLSVLLLMGLYFMKKKNEWTQLITESRRKEQ